MKKVLSIAVAAICGILVLASCNKEKTMTEMLTIEKGWVLSEATTTPYWTLNDNAQIENLFEGYIYDCEKDDIITFKEDGFEYLNPGKLVCEDQPSQESSLGKWELKEDTLSMQIPFFYDEDLEVCKIVELTKDMLKIDYTWTLTADEAKGKPGTYTFHMTYVPAK